MQFLILQDHPSLFGGRAEDREEGFEDSEGKREAGIKEQLICNRECFCFSWSPCVKFWLLLWEDEDCSNNTCCQLNLDEFHSLHNHFIDTYDIENEVFNRYFYFYCLQNPWISKGLQFWIFYWLLAAVFLSVDNNV